MINRRSLYFIGLILTAVFLVSCVRPTNRVENPNVGGDTPVVTDENPLDPPADTTDDGTTTDPAAPTAVPVEEGNTDDGSTDDGSTDDGSTDDGSTDDGSTDDGNTDDGSTDDGSTDDGSTDDGSTDDGSTDDGSTDDGSTDDGNTDDGNTDDGSTDDGSSTETPGEHVVKKGENLYRIGLLYGIPFLEIAELNGLKPPFRITVGQTLKLPGNDETEPPVEPPAEETTYVVKKGDTLFKIGLMFDVSWVQIAEANGLDNPNLITPGDTLKIPENTPGPSPQFTHTVKKGDTLYSIAVQYGVTWTAVAAENNISSPYIIFAGSTLKIPGAE